MKSFVAEMFPHYFNPEDLGKSLREVVADVIKTSRRDVLSRWFHSSKDADLFIWMDLKRNINFRKVGSSQNMPTEQMIARFGELLGSAPAVVDSPSVWARLKARILGLFKF